MFDKKYVMKVTFEQLQKQMLNKFCKQRVGSATNSSHCWPGPGAVHSSQRQRASPKSFYIFVTSHFVIKTKTPCQLLWETGIQTQWVSSTLKTYARSLMPRETWWCLLYSRRDLSNIRDKSLKKYIGIIKSHIPYM